MEFLWSRDEVPPVASNPLTSCPTGGRTGRRPPGRRRSPEAGVCQVVQNGLAECHRNVYIGIKMTLPLPARRLAGHPGRVITRGGLDAGSGRGALHTGCA